MSNSSSQRKAIGANISAGIFSFREILTDFKLIIPTYQREYRWSSEQVATFVTDAFQDCLISGLPKFYGSVTWSEEGDGGNERKVVDGQQRTTTAFLLVAALRSILSSSAGTEKDVALCNQLLVGRLTSQHRKAQLVIDGIRRGEFEQSTSKLSQALKAASESLPGATYLASYKKLKLCISGLIKDSYSVSGTSLSLEDYKVQTAQSFLNSFLDQAGLAAVTVTGHQNAVKLFIKQHETLSPLDDFDTLKGALFGITPNSSLKVLANGFNKIQEGLWGPEASKSKNPEKTLQHVLFGIYDGPKDSPSAGDVLSWAKAGGNSKSPVSFLQNELTPGFLALEAATEKMTTPSGSLSEPLVHIMSTPLKTFRQAYPVLVAARKLPLADFDTVIACLRDTLLVAICVQGNPNKLSTALANMTRSVNRGNVAEAVEAMETFRAESYSEAFAQEFPKVGLKYPRTSTDGRNIVRLLMLLAANSTDQNLGMSWSKLRDSSAWHIEHIFPQSRSWEGNDFLDAENQKHRLGNLSMLEADKNQDISDGDFDLKKEAYSTSDFPLTVDLACSNPLTNRATGFSEWGFTEFTTRTDDLYQIFVELFSLSKYPMSPLPNVAPPGYASAACLPQLAFSGFKGFMDAVGSGENDRQQLAFLAEDRDDRQVAYFKSLMSAAGLIEEDGSEKSQDSQEVLVSESFVTRWNAAVWESDQLKLFQEARELAWEGSATRKAVVSAFEAVRNDNASDLGTLREAVVREKAISKACDALSAMKWHDKKALTGETLKRRVSEAYNFLYNLPAS